MVSIFGTSLKTLKTPKSSSNAQQLIKSMWKKEIIRVKTDSPTTRRGIRRTAREEVREGPVFRNKSNFIAVHHHISTVYS